MAEKSAPRVAELLNSVGHKQAPIEDREITAHCGPCDANLSLVSCLFKSGEESSYTCPKCGTVLVVVSPAREGAKPIPGGGYRLNEFVLKNAAELRFRHVIIPPPGSGSTSTFGFLQ